MIEGICWIGGYILCAVIVHFINVFYIFNSPTEAYDDETQVMMILLGPITLVILLIVAPFLAVQELPNWWTKRQIAKLNLGNPKDLLAEYNDFLDVELIKTKTKRKTTRRRKNALS